MPRLLHSPMMRCLLAVPLLGGAALAAAADDRDPWEGVNRKVFGFNERFDTWIGKPLARGYQAVTTETIDTHVTAFFRNLDDVTNAANFALQGEGRKSLDAAGRVIANTSLGVGGIFDVASTGGISRRETSFGTTLGKWGVGAGHYLVLPFLGPSTMRDTAAIPVDWVFHPLAKPGTLVPSDTSRYALEGLLLTDKRADLLRYEEAVVGDRYSFIRDIYLQHRDFSVNGARPADAFLEDDGGEEDAGDESGQE